MKRQTDIIKVEEIPVSEQSYPFCSAKRYGLLGDSQYQEKEYYLYGTANVYQTEVNGKIEPRHLNVPYINRCIIRSPEKTEAFSGNVVVEIINPTSFMDIERMWILGQRQFMRNGDIYVGITSKPNTIARLLEFNHERYEKLSWPNPDKDVPFPFTESDIQKCGNVLPDQNIEYETGLFWDMLTDLAVLLRSNDEKNPLLQYHPETIVLTGWSQSANYLIRYVNDFAYKEDLGYDVFDGFLAGGPPRYLPVPVNQYETLKCAENEKVQIRHVKNPCIVFQTESENSLLGAKDVVRNDGMEEQFMCIHYDVTGSSHDTVYSLIDYYRKDTDLVRMGAMPGYAGLDKEANNYPLEVLVDAMFRNLFYWIQTGVAPAKTERIQTNCDGENQKDALGNTIGGLRTCLLDYPTGSFLATAILKKAVILYSLILTKIIFLDMRSLIQQKC